LRHVCDFGARHPAVRLPRPTNRVPAHPAGRSHAGDLSGR